MDERILIVAGWDSEVGLGKFIMENPVSCPKMIEWGLLIINMWLILIKFKSNDDNMLFEDKERRTILEPESSCFSCKPNFRYRTYTMWDGILEATTCVYDSLETIASHVCDAIRWYQRMRPGVWGLVGLKVFGTTLLRQNRASVKLN